MKSCNKVEHLEEFGVGELVQPGTIPDHSDSEVRIGNYCVCSDDNIHNTKASFITHKTGKLVIDLPTKVKYKLQITRLQYKIVY